MSNDDLASAALAKWRTSAATQEAFFQREAPAIAACARALAAVLDGGGRLYTLGNGGSACDAQHLAVEFMHPVVTRRVAFPALALPCDPALLTAVGNDEDFALGFARQIRLLARPGDAVVALSTSGRSANVLRALGAARELGLVTVGLTGGDGGRMADACDHLFVVPSFSIHRIQEAHVLLLHLLWDLVHLARGEEDVL
ncbi:MAG TPA: SIS domain-containing protein [Kofleriaceae bacterium]|jgi:D-sedoheptulose 7-phosphate isomerase